MKMKKILALVMALVLVLSLAACQNSSGSTTGGDSEKKSIGICIYKFDDNFMTTYRKNLEDSLKAKGYDVTIVDGNNDQAKQTEQINTFISQGVDALIINPVMTTAADAIVNQVKAAGIPTVFINREPTAEIMQLWDKIAYVGCDAAQSGTFQGELILETANKGDINGDGVISYIMIQGDPENVDAKYRTEFSIKALEDAGITVECLDDQVGNWATDKGQQIAANALSAHGDKIDVIFCNNDGMALGAAAAITAAGRTVGEDIYLLGVDALEECQEMVKNGTMTGTVLNDHVGQSHKAVDVAVQALNGEAIDNYYWVDYVKVDASYFG